MTNPGLEAAKPAIPELPAKCEPAPGSPSGELLRASGRTLATTAMITGIGFFASVITARVLGPEGRGLLSAALLIATVAASLSQFGLANSFVYHRGAGRIFSYSRLITCSMLFAFSVAVALAAGGLQVSGDPRLHGELLLVTGLAGFMAVQAYFSGLSQIRPGLVFFNLMRFSLVAGNLVLLLWLLAAYESIDFRKILVAQLLVAAVLALAGCLWVRRALPVVDPTSTGRRATWRELLVYGLSHHGTVVLGIVLLNFDKIVLLKMGTMVQYGFYALAFSTSRLIGALQEAVSTALYARFAGGNINLLSNGVRAAFRLTFVPMLLVAAFAAALSPWIIPLVFGEAFASMAAVFSILLFECVIGGASWILAQRFNAAGRPGMVFARQLVSVLPIFLAVPFLPQEHIHLYLAILMLAGAILRLGVTLALFPAVLKESFPGLLPTAQDIRAVRNLLAGNAAR